ncbi:MAG: cell wall protein [Microbacterium sp.]|uniref:cell wall protein n=1 Tax=unclassified Microbacterium TaxID=2609290 RepID=UPI0009295171|nr:MULTISPECIES: cell wall protein [unclassified Microbacterium]OJU66165.1 MAG: cell wall protein [Microbacterium sp. 70-38]MBN9189387.1 cell wall protein [Microbacterium sp.]MBN9191341.1 cell wall protein [Microbacterium sp.]MBN9195476.1 cell wall protein [Microbacterium sp.]OJU79598.1 MAG: cell wall protein [Microbacterium sp. 71-23]
MFRKLAAAVAVAAALTIALPTAALAADDNYTPSTPTAPTLAGSSAAGACEGNVPWITYKVTMTDPDNQATSHTAYLVLSDGTNTTSILLGDLVDNQLSGKVLWPGASVGADGKGTSWPGWEQKDGQWVQTGGNFGWTRGAITAEIKVNPDLTVPLSYPAATSACATAIEGQPAADPSGTLPVTGLGVAVLPIGLAGGAIVVLGAALLLTRRLRRH